MAMFATHAERHGERPHERGHLVARHVLGKNLKVLWWLTTPAGTPTGRPATLGSQHNRRANSEERDRTQTEQTHGD